MTNEDRFQDGLLQLRSPEFTTEGPGFAHPLDDSKRFIAHGLRIRVGPWPPQFFFYVRNVEWFFNDDGSFRVDIDAQQLSNYSLIKNGYMLAIKLTPDMFVPVNSSYQIRKGSDYNEHFMGLKALTQETKPLPSLAEFDTMKLLMNEIVWDDSLIRTALSIAREEIFGV